jgi:hypothetical protein
MVEVLPGGDSIIDVSLFQLGGSITGSGTMSVNKEYCSTGGPVGDNCPKPVGGVLPGNRTLTVNQITTTAMANLPAPVDEMGVSDVLALNTFLGVNSSAHVSAFANQFSEGPPIVVIPESSTWAMLILGFTGSHSRAIERRARRRRSPD